MKLSIPAHMTRQQHMDTVRHEMSHFEAGLRFAFERQFQLGMVVGAALINWAQAIHDGPCTCRCRQGQFGLYKEDCPLHYTQNSMLKMLRGHMCPHRRTFCKPGNLCLGCGAGKKRREDD